ncbi:MAG: sulfotransferase domain-containing protein [Moorea sp. SIO4E2]|uniref:sulfotransferase domain-containing protein n=1 Tax=Moorena sp. SIO4E2 TaxID=2607826 RepID=UPI0013B7250E|nr:sulfotransferase domain-containing protein [Moorena sp. SIO4E2]NEQ10558.1 sulfotransferase domain-containing protein [Moorena sp. SIO4E2]
MLDQGIQLGRVLINSAPSGSPHILAKAIEIFGYKGYATGSDYKIDTPKSFNYKETKRALKEGKKVPSESGDNIGLGGLSPYYVDLSTLQYWLDAVPQGQYILGHIPWTAKLSQTLADLNYHNLCIIRDPRDIVASMIPFILDTGKPIKHFLEADFKQMSAGQRLNFIFQGGYAPQAGVEVNSFAEVYRSMLAWRKEPNCLFVHFEDLVGEEGGGSVQKQKNVIKSIASHLGCPFDDKIYDKLPEIYRSSAQTLRIGKIDGWKSAMDTESLESLVEYCKPLCREAGY